METDNERTAAKGGWRLVDLGMGGSGDERTVAGGGWRRWENRRLACIRGTLS